MKKSPSVLSTYSGSQLNLSNIASLTIVLPSLSPANIVIVVDNCWPLELKYFILTSVLFSRRPSKVAAVNFTPLSTFSALTLILKYFPGSECDVLNSIPSMLMSDM